MHHGWRGKLHAAPVRRSNGAQVDDRGGSVGVWGVLLVQVIEEDLTGEAMVAAAAPSAELGEEGNGGDSYEQKVQLDEVF